MKKDSDSQRIISWLLNFAQIDLDALPDGDKAKLLYETYEILFGMPVNRVALVSTTIIKPAYLQLSDESMGRIKKFQDALIGFLEGLFLVEDKKEPYPIDWHTNITLSRTGMINPIKIIEPEEMRPVEKFIEASLAISLAIDVPITTVIRRCSECGRYYLHVSKKKKDYCNPKCTNRAKARQRRKDLKEKHPRKYKKYLKGQRDRMRKVYEEKKKKEPGLKIRVGIKPRAKTRARIEKARKKVKS